MKNKLMLQLSLPIVILFIVTSFSIIIIFHSFNKKSDDEIQQRLYYHLAKNIITSNPNLKKGIINKQSLKAAFHKIMQLGPEFEIYALNKNGKILTYSAPKNTVKLKYIQIKPIITFLNQEDYPIYGVDPKRPNMKRIFVAAEIYSQNKKIKGYLYVLLGGKKTAIANSIDNYLQMFIWFFIIMLLLTMIVTLYLFHQITKPILNLSQIMLKFKSSNFKQLPPKIHEKIWNTNEIKILDDGFHDLANQVISQFKQIKSTEQLRKELLSHLSHDLKTPLVSLRGYLETWLLNINTEGREYIQIALDNSTQLQNLVEQILELSSLQNNKVSIHKEPIAIADLIQDILNTFSLIAKQKNLNLQLIPKDSSIQVIADIKALERILINLINNAVCHSNNNETICIKLLKQSKHLLIKIIDQGCGIPKEEIKHIFNANYRASNSLSPGIFNNGLGLAIVKRLLLES